MSEKLISTISGIRGIIGKNLFAETALQAGKAYGTYIRGRKVIIGGDSRTSHLMLKSALISGLMAAGCDVIDIGICPTPTVEMAILGNNAYGGVAITASHNPIQWNGLKFFNNKGEFLTAKQYENFRKYLENKDLPSKNWDKIGSITADLSWNERHVDAVCKLKLVNLTKIRRRKFKVVIDAVNGAGSNPCPMLLEKLGCRIMRINCVPDGRFPHNPEPVPANLKMLGEAVVASKADIGFAVDPDADRLAIVDGYGNPIGEEYTLAIAADYVLSKNPGNMVINLSSSNLNLDVCLHHKSKLYHSKVGEANVVEMMHKKNAVIGGEGNGGVILPDLHYGRDSLVGIALILQMMATSRKSISQLVYKIGEYTIVKSKGNLTKDFELKLKKLQKKLHKQKITTVDGVRVDFNNGWVHIRKSNTEPIYRLIAEARTKREANALIKFIREKL